VGKPPSSTRRLQWGKENATTKILPMFDPTGKVAAAATNAPAWHDSKVARLGGLCKIIDKFPLPHCVLADAAFRGSVTGTKILRPLRKGEFLPDGMTHQDDSFHEKQLIRTRQPGEWANSTMVQLFKELRQTSCDDDGLNALKMEATIPLHNLRVAHSNRNEIKQVFLDAQTRLHEFQMISSRQIGCVSKHECCNPNECMCAHESQ
jgi:hypothetical protein